MAETTEAPKRPEAVLDINTFVERPKVRIDGELYDILHPDELSVVDSHRLTAQGRRINDLMAKASLSDREKKEILGLLADVSGHILVGVPDAVRATLSDVHRQQVIEVFMMLPLNARLKRLAAAGAGLTERLAGELKAGAKKTPPTGAKSRRGSKGSTAATRGGGSSKRR